MVHRQWRGYPSPIRGETDRRMLAVGVNPMDVVGYAVAETKAGCPKGPACDLQYTELAVIGCSGDGEGPRKTVAKILKMMKNVHAGTQMESSNVQRSIAKDPSMLLKKFEDPSPFRLRPGFWERRFSWQGTMLDIGDAVTTPGEVKAVVAHAKIQTIEACKYASECTLKAEVEGVTRQGNYSCMSGCVGTDSAANLLCNLRPDLIFSMESRPS